MPLLTNPKHERFAQEIAKGTSANRAYVIAGYKEHRQNASGLARKKPIRDRVNEIHEATADLDREATERAAAALSIDKRWVMERLMDNAQSARQSGDFAPSNKALELLGKQLGMFKEQGQVSGEIVMRWMNMDT